MGEIRASSDSLAGEKKTTATSDDDPGLHATADLLEAVLATRPERVTARVFPGLPPEAHGAIRATTEVAAAVALAEAPVAPSAGLRARILGTIAKLGAATPRRATLVVDMLNVHLVPGRPLEVPRARAIVATLAARLDRARAEGTPVIYVCDRHESIDDADYGHWPVHNLAGTEGADVWPALAPKPSDHVVAKPAISGFVRSTLEQALTDLGVDTLVLTGCATELQLMATATDALQLGFVVEMPADSQAGASEIGEQVVLGTLSALAPYGPARRARLERIAATVHA